MVAWCLVTAMIAAGLTRTALAYAHWRQLLDFPGQRRSHSLPTPRGGGVAIVICVAMALPWVSWDEWVVPSVLGVTLLAVAGVGWLDDHRPQPVVRRLLVHIAAATGLAWALPMPHLLPWGTWWMPLVIAVCAVWLVACINAWNFMDGSNGLLASQCLWLGAALAMIGLVGDEASKPGPWIMVAWTMAGACMGFLPFNFPRARIFLGDVGSGALGLICGVLIWVAVASAPEHFWVWVVLPSALLVDASLTLASRVVSGRRWYTAHREHLYQWLIRSGRGHAQVALLYMAWNLVVVLPVLVVMKAWPEHSMMLALSVLVLASGIWWFGKRAVMRRRRAVCRAGRQVPVQGRS